MKKLVMVFVVAIYCGVANAVSLLDFGAVGDGNPIHHINNYNAFKSALDSGNPVFIPAGTYYIASSPASVEDISLRPKAGVKVYGEGKGLTRLIFLSSGTAYKVLFRISNSNVTFEDLSIKLEGAASDSAQMFFLSGDNFTINQSELDGGNTVANSNFVNAFTFANADTKNIKIQNSDIHNVQRVIFRENASTGKIENVQVTGNFIHDLGQGGVQFNTPTEPAKKITVASNHFSDFHAGTEQIFVGFASAHYVNVSDNVFSGKAKNCIHLEQDSDNITITGNVCEADAHGVFIQDNNIEGPRKNSDYVTIVGNTFFDGSLTRKNDGIQAINDGSPMSAFTSLIIEGNTFKGYKSAVALDNDAYIVSNNIFVNNDYGIRLHALPLQTIKNNIFRNCEHNIFSINSIPAITVDYE